MVTVSRSPQSFTEKSTGAPSGVGPKSSTQLSKAARARINNANDSKILRSSSSDGSVRLSQLSLEASSVSSNSLGSETIEGRQHLAQSWLDDASEKANQKNINNACCDLVEHALAIAKTTKLEANTGLGRLFQKNKLKKAAEALRQQLITKLKAVANKAAPNQDKSDINSVIAALEKGKSVQFVYQNLEAVNGVHNGDKTELNNKLSSYSKKLLETQN